MSRLLKDNEGNAHFIGGVLADRFPCGFFNGCRVVNTLTDML
jgi:hypothetical protein